MRKAEGQSVSIRVHQWFYSPDHGQLCQVIEAQTLWGETTCRVWLPGRGSLVHISDRSSKRS